jgi:hypothetical protein
MEQITLQLTGTAPLLMHAPRTVNPLDEITKEIKSYTGKRTKTLEDHETIARLEWEAGLYFDPEVGPYLPDVNVLRCLQDSAKITRDGRNVERGVFSVESILPLQYPGPRGTNGGGKQQLWDHNLKDLRVVGNQQNSVMRCRPMFPGWSLDVSLLIDESVIDAEQVVAIAKRAGVMIGLGDYRPRFGRFNAETR